MFVWRVGAFLAELERQQPALRAGPGRDRRRLGHAGPGPRARRGLADAAKISVDYGVMEGAADAGLVATVPGDFGWTDVGDFDALGEVLAGPARPWSTRPATSSSPRPSRPRCCCGTPAGSVVVAQSGRLVATLGLHDMVVVDTPDAVLVCRRDRAQDIKSLVDELKQLGEHRFLSRASKPGTSAPA